MLSEVPPGWELSTLGDLGRWAGGGTPNKGKAEYWRGGTILWVSPKDMKSTTITATEDYITEAAVKESSTRVVPKGSVLIVTRSGILRHTFPVAKAGLPLAINQDIKALVPSDDIDNGFAFSVIQASSEEILKTCTKIGTTVESVDFPSLSQLEIPLPPLPEQRKIAEILGSVDEAIRATEAVIEQTRRVKEGLLQELLTKGIGHTRFKKTPIGEIPEEWEVKRLLEASDEDKGSFVNGPFGSDLLSSELNQEGGVPVIYIRDIKRGKYEREKSVYVTNEKARQLSLCQVNGGDLLITKVGDPPGVAAIYPSSEPSGIITQDVIRIRLQPFVLAGWVKAFLDSQRGKNSIDNIAIEGTRKRVSLGEFKRLLFPVPPIEEQTRIARVLEGAADAIGRSERDLRQLRSLKQGLLQDLLTGKVRVSTK